MLLPSWRESIGDRWILHRSPMDSPHKGPVTRKIFQCDDVIITYMCHGWLYLQSMRCRPKQSEAMVYNVWKLTRIILWILLNNIRPVIVKWVRLPPYITLISRRLPGSSWVIVHVAMWPITQHRGRCCRWWQDSLWAPAIICICTGSKPQNHVNFLYLSGYTSETRYVQGWCQFLPKLATISWFLLWSLMHISAAPLCLAVAKHGANLHWSPCVV